MRATAAHPAMKSRIHLLRQNGVSAEERYYLHGKPPRCPAAQARARRLQPGEPMTIRRATTEMGTFFYLAEDFYIAAEFDRGLAWELSVLQTALAHLPAEGPCNVVG